MISCVVVDDDVDILDAFCDYLERSGLEILAIGTNGVDAVSLYEKFCPSVVFVDLEIPNHGGFNAVKTIRNSHPDAKIIVVTADKDTDVTYLLDTLHVTQIIYKPFNMHMVKETVTLALLS